MTHRRDFLKRSLLSAGALAALNTPSLAATSSRPPTRFIFMHRGNGLWPRVCVPPSLDKKAMECEKRKEAIDEDLDGHDLPNWLGPLAAHRENLTILQGVSGKMCTTGHHSWCSALGVFKANERPSSIKWAKRRRRVEEWDLRCYVHTSPLSFAKAQARSENSTSDIHQTSA